MTSFHKNRNSGELVACAHDPCGLHHDDIRADTLEEAYEQYNDAVFDNTSYGYTDFIRMNNPYNGHGITRKAFDTQVNNVSNVINDDDWEILKASTEDIDSIISRNYGVGGEQRRKVVANNIADYLSSDDAKPLRKYMGENIDVNDIAIMLTYNVSTMTKPAPISRSVTRCILSRTGNDMNKKRYISSVLFFGGRCCYCGRILHKSTGLGKIDDSAATAEHIDPMDGNPHGETKYGNVALCCNSCNNSKGNQSLDEWRDGNITMNQHQKDMMTSRIRDFHQYTMYEPMSMEKSREIDRIIEQAHKDEEELAIHGDDRNMPPRKNGETNSQYRKRNRGFLVARNRRRKITIKKEAIARALML